MDGKDKLGRMETTDDEASSAEAAPEDKPPWQPPKLTFVEPKLTRHGDFAEVTGQFFGAFSP